MSAAPALAELRTRGAALLAPNLPRFMKPEEAARQASKPNLPSIWMRVALLFALSVYGSSDVMSRRPVVRGNGH